jgi:transcriptional regulator with XRE-family HTH domain
VAKDWDAVGAAIRARLIEIDMTQAELAARAGVALMTVRELQHNLKSRRRNPRTLAAISEALGWPSDQLARILDGQRVHPVDEGDPVLAELDAVKADLHAIVRRLDAIERRLGPADEQS